MDVPVPGIKLRHPGFSLIELMLVVLIICVLTILSMSRLSGSNRDKLKAACQKNLQTIYLSLSIYANDNKGQFPVVKEATTAEEPLAVLVPKYTTVTEAFICPASSDRKLPEGESFARKRVSYAYYMGRTTNETTDQVIVSDRQVDTTVKRLGQPIFSADGNKPGANHGKYGGNFVMLSGETAHCGANADRDFLFGTNITLLNPR
jgi:prepilin-type N-terminal cleavage/methylation domain-containing protein